MFVQFDYTLRETLSSKAFTATLHVESLLRSNIFDHDNMSYVEYAINLHQLKCHQVRRGIEVMLAHAYPATEQSANSMLIERVKFCSLSLTANCKLSGNKTHGGCITLFILLALMNTCQR